MIDDNSLLEAQLSNMSRLDVKLDEMFHFEFLRFRFGRMTKESYIKLTTFLNDLEAVFIKGAKRWDLYTVCILLRENMRRK